MNEKTQERAKENTRGIDMKVKIESKHTPNQSELGKKESQGSKPFNIKLK